MSYLSKEKSFKYLYNSTIIFIANLFLIILKFNDSLTKRWLMIGYIIFILVQLIILGYIFIKNNINNEEIKTTSKEYKLFDYIAPMVIMASIFMLLFGNIMVSGKIDGVSMEPSLYHNQNILIYRFENSPKHNEVVIVTSTNSQGEEELIIKRIVAVPGDKIRYHETMQGYGLIFINETLYRNNYSIDQYGPFLFSKEEYIKMAEKEFINGHYQNEVTLSKGYYIAIGDNFYNSSDSRHHGAFQISQINGRMIFKFGGDKNE